MLPIMLQGRRVYEFPELADVKKYASEQLNALPEKYKEISRTKKYPVYISKELDKLRHTLLDRFTREYDIKSSGK